MEELKVPLREPQWNERSTAGSRENTGVYRLAGGSPFESPQNFGCPILRGFMQRAGVPGERSLLAGVERGRPLIYAHPLYAI